MNHDKNRSNSPTDAKLERGLSTSWLLLLVVLSPLGLGASCDDEAVVGDECPAGMEDKCLAEGGDGNVPNPPEAGKGGKGGEPGPAPGGTGGKTGTGGAVGEGGETSSNDICGGLTGAACADGEYCNFPKEALCGAADATGTCEPIPQACDAIYDPVCGCDDKTYSNACVAAMAGVSVGSPGECEPPVGDGACGSRGLPECPDGQFCDYPASAECGANDKPGQCTDKPDVCGNIYAPVCGCDGKTYGNACEARGAGVSVASEGECKPDTGDGEACGGLLGLKCADGEYCNYPEDAICGAADATGICTEIPAACTKEFNPVCGCDGQTYSNPCMAAAAGVSVQKAGECEAGGGTGDDCGGIAALKCGADEFCFYTPEQKCGAGDMTGVCKPKSKEPVACTTQYDPVCGCDGKTYGNACTASGANVSIAHAGECET